MTTQLETSEPTGNPPRWLEIVRRHVDSLQFGVVQIVVHDSQVTQIDKTERVRFEKAKPFKPTGIPEAK
jgi:hypothetical protein